MVYIQSMQGSNKGGLLGRRVNEETVAHVLYMIATQPNFRQVPQPGDLEGEYDYWFDDGACKAHRGGQLFVLRDGTHVEVAAPWPVLSLTIRFPDHRVINIQQEPW